MVLNKLTQNERNYIPISHNVFVNSFIDVLSREAKKVYCGFWDFEYNIYHCFIPFIVLLMVIEYHNETMKYTKKILYSPKPLSYLYFHIIILIFCNVKDFSYQCCNLYFGYRGHLVPLKEAKIQIIGTMLS